MSLNIYEEEINRIIDSQEVIFYDEEEYKQDIHDIRVHLGCDLVLTSYVMWNNLYEKIGELTPELKKYLKLILEEFGISEEGLVEELDIGNIDLNDLEQKVAPFIKSRIDEIKRKN